MKKLIKLITFFGFLLILTGCQEVDNWSKGLQEATSGLQGTIQTYDENSQIIDRINGQSILINTDDRFDITDSEGNISKESSVLNITVGGKEVLHVGSTLIFFEPGLKDLLTEYPMEVNTDNFDRSLPFINRFYNSIKNNWSGGSKLILVRSQSGVPLATFSGNKVSTFSADGIPNTTKLLVDGKRLLIYRADFTIYDTSLLE